MSFFKTLLDAVLKFFSFLEQRRKKKLGEFIENWKVKRNKRYRDAGLEPPID